MKAYVSRIHCSECGATLYMLDGILIHPKSHRLGTPCRYDKCAFSPLTFELAPATRDTNAPPPPGPSIDARPPTPPLAPTPSPARGSNEDMVHADRSNKKPRTESDSEIPLKKFRKEIEGWGQEIVDEAKRLVEYGRENPRSDMIFIRVNLDMKVARILESAIQYGWWEGFRSEGRVDGPPSVEPERVAGIEEEVPREPSTDAEKDYADMRRFQAKFIEVDQELRALKERL